MTSHCDKLVDSGRRKFLTGASVAAAGAAASAIVAPSEGRTCRARASTIRPTGSATCVTSRSMSR